MITLSKPITDAEVEAAAAYFSALQPRKRIKVIESLTVPKIFIDGKSKRQVTANRRRKQCLP